MIHALAGAILSALILYLIEIAPARRARRKADAAASRPHADRPRVTARLVGGPCDGLVTDMSVDAARINIPACRADGYGFEQAVYEVAEEVRTLRHVPGTANAR